MMYLSRAVAWLMRSFIFIYRYSLSYFIGRQCRFEPTCSVYADQAIKQYGPIGGGRLALKRLCRCHPWGDGGYDPIPDSLPE